MSEYELDDFKYNYENNNFKNGGHQAFTEDENKLYKEIDEIKEEISRYL